MARRRRGVSLLVVGVGTFVLALLILGSGFTGMAAGETVTQCETIDSAGTYTLNGSFTGSTTDACVVINSSDVVLDGQNNTITMSDSGDAVNVTSSGSIQNVTVRNLNVEGGHDGITVHAPADDATVDVALVNNTINGTAGEGIDYVADGNRSAVNVTIHDNRITNNGSGGIDIGTNGTDSEIHVTISSNLINSTAEHGIGDIYADADGQTVEIGIHDNTVNTTSGSSNGVDDLIADGANASVTVSVTNNTADVDNDFVNDVHADNTNQTVDIDFRENLILADDDAVQDLEAHGTETVLNVTLVNNTLDVLEDGFDEIDADADDQEVAVDISDNTISTVSDGIDDIDTDGTNTTASVSVVNNTIDSGTDGIDDIEADYDVNQTVDIDVVDNEITADDEAIEDIETTGEHTTADVTLTDNRLNSSSQEGIDDLDIAEDDDQRSTLTFANNTVIADDEAIDDLDAYGTNTTVDISITNNSFRSTTDEGFDNIEADHNNQTVHLRMEDNRFTTDEDSIEDIEVDGADTTANVTIEDNAIDTNDTGIEDIDVDGNDSTIDFDILDNTIETEVSGIEDYRVDGLNQTLDIDISHNRITGFGTDGVHFEAIHLLDANSGDINVSRNSIESDVGDAGIEIRPRDGTEPPGGVLLIERNYVDVGGDAVKIAEPVELSDDDTPVAGIRIHYNQLVGDTYGVNSTNRTAGTYVNATHNYWNTSDGPDSSGPVEDPVTGVVANGSGSNITTSNETGVSNVHFDPYLSSPPDAGLTIDIQYAKSAASARGTDPAGSPVYAEHPVIATRTGSVYIGNSSSQRLRVRRPDTTESVTVDLASDADTYDAQQVRLRIYDGDGQILSQPKLGLKLDDGSSITVNASITGDRGMFSNASTFEEYTVDLIRGTEPTVLASTDPALHGIGYPGPLTQNTTRGTIGISLNRTSAIDDSWTVEYVVRPDSSSTPILTRNVTNSAGADTFDTTVASDSLRSGNYFHTMNIFETADAPTGERLVSVFSLRTGPHNLTVERENLSVRFEPASQTAPTGAQRTYDLYLENATKGVSSYNLTVSLSNRSAASFADFTHVQRPTINGTTINNTAGTLRANATFGTADPPSGDEIRLGTITVTGATGGQTELTLNSSTSSVRNAELFTRYEIENVSEANLTVDAPEVNIETNTSALDYGDVRATTDASNAANRTVRLKNTGSDTLSYEASLVGLDADQFDIVAGNASGELDGSTTETLTIEYRPSLPRTARARLNITTNFPNERASVALNGTGTSPEVVTRGNYLNFGLVNISAATEETRQVTVANNGSAPLNITGLTGIDTTPFESERIAGTVVQPNSNATINISVNGTNLDTTGRVVATVRVAHNDTFRPPSEVTLAAEAADPTPKLLARPTRIDFGTLARGVNESVLVVVSNDGTAAINVTELNVTGTASANFTAAFADDQTPVTLDPGTVAFVEVRAIGATNAAFNGVQALNITTDAGQNRSIPLTGTVEAPALGDTTREVGFGTVSVNSTASETVSVSNTGTGNLTLDVGTALSSDSVFGVRSVSSPSASEVVVPPGETHTLRVTFTPDATGDATATATVATNEPGGTLNLDLSGTGVSTNLTANESSLTFSAGRNETASTTVKITNDGNETIDSLTFSVGGPFTISDKPSGLAGGASANVTVTFDPTSAGAATETLTVSSDDASLSIAVRGTALPPEVRARPAVLPLGFVQAGGTETRRLRLVNDGPAGTTVTVTLGSATSTDGQFRLDANAPSSVTITGGNETTVPVVFEPASGSSGRQSGTLELPTDDPNTPILQVDVTGSVATPTATVTEPTDGSLSFGEIPVGTQSAERTVTLRNEGSASLTVRTARVDDDQFAVVAAPSNATLVPGATAEIDVVATPNATDLSAGSTAETLESTLTIETPDDDNPTVTLAQNATEPNASVVQTASTLEFGTVEVGNSTDREFTIVNDGDAPLELDAPTVGDDAFTVVSGDSSTRLAAGEHITISTAYGPSAQGGNTTSLTVGTNDPDRQTITRTLNGSGSSANVTLTRTGISFGRVGVSTSTTETFRVENTGADTATINSVSLAGANASRFTLRTAPGDNTDIGAGESELIDVSVTPDRTGTITARVVVDTSEGTRIARLGATGTEPNLTVGDATFERTRVGARSTEQVTLRNTGNAPLNVSSVVVSGTDDETFRVLDAPSVIEPKDAADVVVAYAPGDFNTSLRDTAVADANANRSQDALLDILTNVSDENERVTLSGTGKTPGLERSKSSLGFGTVAIGDTASASVNITNNASASANITIESVDIFGADAGDFTLESTNVEGQTLTPTGDNVTLNVSLTPSSAGIKTGVLSITTNDPRQPAQAVYLSNSQTIVNVEFGSVNATYENVIAGEQPGAEFDRGLETNASVRGLQPNVSASDSFSVRTDGSDTTITGEPTLDRSGVTSIRYLNATTTASADNLTDNEFTFRVSKAAFAGANGTDPTTNVTLYHENNSGGYDVLETTLIDETRTSYIYRATTDGFSVFAIGVADSEDDESDDSGEDTDDTEASAPEVGGGGGGGGGAEPDPIVQTAQTDTGMTATIEKVPAAGQTVAVTPRGVETGSIAVREVRTSFEAASLEATQLSITASASKPAQTPDPPRAGQVLSYVEIDLQGSLAEQQGAGTFTFDVSDGVSAEAVTVQRYDGDTWESVETEAVDASTVRVISPEGYSVFAIGTKEESEPESPTPTETASDGGDTPTTPTETETETDTETPSAVTETPTGDRTPTPTTAAPPTPTATPGAKGPGFGPIGVLLALMAISLWTVRRRH